MVALKNGCVERCPGCSHRTMSMQESHAQKEGWIRKQLNVWKDIIESIRSVDESGRWNYRRKILLTARCENRRWDFGMIRRDEFIAIPDCPVHAPVTRKLIRLLMAVLPPAGDFPLAYLYQSDALVTLVLKTKQHPGDRWLDKTVKTRLQSIGIRGLSLHLNPSAGRRMFAKSGWHLLWGADHAYNDSGLLYGRTSFSQLIHELHGLSLDEAAAFLNPGYDDCVVDLYSGIGSSLVRWTDREAHTIGVETGGEAVACAIKNSPESVILRGRCGQRLPQLQQWIEVTHLQGKKKLVYANPPRTGIEPEVLKWITEQMMPERLAYLSCSAGTLRRDLDMLVSKGFEVKKIIPYDFFPQTHHVECLALVEKT
ncbi:MAG: class I SAM-dependent RNA methyltransferase [Bacteroidales bacterium]|nr:class I SAM-dependent RNA methyltransferase [Bacteroidales bacterium]